MTPEDAKTLIRETVDNGHRDEWVECGSVAFIWDGSNRFRVRDESTNVVPAYGSTTVVECLCRGHIGKAVVQAVKLEWAAEIREMDRGVR